MDVDGERVDVHKFGDARFVTQRVALADVVPTIEALARREHELPEPQIHLPWRGDMFDYGSADEKRQREHYLMTGCPMVQLVAIPATTKDLRGNDRVVAVYARSENSILPLSRMSLRELTLYLARTNVEHAKVTTTRAGFHLKHNRFDASKRVVAELETVNAIQKVLEQ